MENRDNKTVEEILKNVPSKNLDLTVKLEGDSVIFNDFEYPNFFVPGVLSSEKCSVLGETVVCFHSAILFNSISASVDREATGAINFFHEVFKADLVSVNKGQLETIDISDEEEECLMQADKALVFDMSYENPDCASYYTMMVIIPVLGIMYKQFKIIHSNLEK
jgi:hypothetical protein